MKKYIIILYAIIIPLLLIGQDQKECASFEIFNKNLLSSSQRREESQVFVSTITQSIRNIIARLSTPELHSDEYTIPVVFHVVQNNASVTVTPTEISNAIDSLNQYYGKGSRYIRPPNRYSSVFKRETYVRFMLAKRNPTNKATNGINIVNVADQTLADVNITSTRRGGVDPWDTKRYLNIWLTHEPHYIDATDPSCPGGRCPFLGMGTFPDITYPDSVTGVILDYKVIKNDASLGCKRIKVFAHEIGHFLGLRHIDGDGASAPASDFVEDTPLQNRHGSTCPSPDDGTMYMNYMDYSCDACRYMFTQGQVARMLSTLNAGGRRSSLLTSNALMLPNVTERNFLSEIGLEPQNRTRPSWEASLIMLHGWACQCSPAMDILMSNVRATYRGLPGLPENISQTARALAITNYRELLVSYPMRDFYSLLNNGPITIIAVGTAGDSYGLVISGIRFDANGQGQLLITDPMNIGPRGFNFQYTNDTSLVREGIGGSQYTVDYNRFFVDLISNALANNKRIFLFSH